MATAATLTYIDAQQILQGYKQTGVPPAESDKFVQGVIDELNNGNNDTYANNVEQVATWAIQVDEAFDTVTRGFANLVAKFGIDFPKLGVFLAEWVVYNQKWVSHLALSRDVASEHVAVLHRFDTVFISMVLEIKTNQDRLDVIAELGQFIDEKHDRSTEMSQGFLNLKRDVEDFVTRFDAWIVKTGTELAARATQLKEEIDALKIEIEELDKQIIAATAAFLTSAIGATTLIGIIGLVVAGTTLAVLIGQRVVKGQNLLTKQAELADVNRKQKELAKIKSEFDGMKPSIGLICEKLVLFAEIWSSVRSQSVQFREVLKGGMDALTNIRFKMELRLASDLCKPLVAGLEKYATALVNRPSKKIGA